MSDKVKEKFSLKSKYEAIVKRSFRTKLELFLFNELSKPKEISGNEPDLTTAFAAFTIQPKIIEELEKSWQLVEGDTLAGMEVGKFDTKIRTWPKENSDLYNALLKKYRSDFQTILFPIEEFEKFYCMESNERKCQYCGISETQIELLRKGNQIKTKRSRGRYMEIDRINSNTEYTNPDTNLILACYYCNNAKTDEFGFEEFKIIGKGITEVWNQRLRFIKQSEIIVARQTF